MRWMLARIGLALYVVWLAAVVVHAASWLGVVPRFDAVYWTVVLGAAVATGVGAARLAGRFYSFVMEQLGGRDGV
ncbi:hypothetical protein [Halorussus litoreus]|uniref:hypothetical protein n=1 Tax=Halorussus litoreus TaxID=1710536 RepID=UPI000E241EC2|nr:hypothetical protein [Halorussus litoreus]